jgi:hypothetical protein
MRAAGSLRWISSGEAGPTSTTGQMKLVAKSVTGTPPKVASSRG